MIRQTLGRVKTASKAIVRAEFDALDLLRSDHMRVESLLLQLRVFHDKERRVKLLNQIRTSLEKHMRIEESVFYPACARLDQFKELIEDSLEEHQEMRNYLRSLENLNPTSLSFSRTVTEFTKCIEKHIWDEENELFPNVRKYMEEKSFKRLNREVQEAHSGVSPMRRVA